MTLEKQGLEYGERRSELSSLFRDAEQELKDLRQEVIKLDHYIQLLKSEKESLQQQLDEAEVKLMNERMELNKQIEDLQVKLVHADVELMNEQVKVYTHLANTPTMIVVESRKVQRFSEESTENVLDSLNCVATSFGLLKQQISDLPRLVQHMINDTTGKFEEAIRETNRDLIQKLLREVQLRKSYHDQLVELRGNIRVFCRVRPMIVEDEGQDSVMSFDPFDDGIIVVSNKGKSLRQFHVDKVFNMNISQSQIFNEVSSLVHSAIDGFNVCIFAYGQTGSGKTYTMEGVAGDPGVNQRSLQLLYEETKIFGWQYTIEASMLEVYNETLRDLLNPDPNTNKLEVKMKPEGGFHIPGLVTFPVNSVQEMNKIADQGKQNRATAATNMNEWSSRSHCLLCVNVIGTNLLTGSKTYGRLNLVDLAGSERVSRSQVDGARLKEAQSINKSLSSLGDVISALKNKHSHIPYRNSKLTYLLQESLGGSSKTLMILQVSPGEEDVNESISTLSFGQRVRSAELGVAKRKVDEGNKVTPTTSRHPNSENSSSSSLTPSKRAANSSKASPIPSKLMRLK